MKHYTKYPSTPITASSIDGVSWDDIWNELKGAQLTVQNFVNYSDSDMVWDTYAEAYNAGESDKVHQLLQASKQFKQSVTDAMNIYQSQVQGIKNGDYIRISE